MKTTIEEFLSELANLDIKLWVEGEANLRCNAPKGALTPDIRTHLNERKTEIINFLQQVNLNSDPAYEPISLIRRDSGELSLSSAQTRLWFLDRLERQSATYNVPAAVQITGDLQVDALERSLVEIVRRHEVLHAHFEQVNGTPVQVIDVDFTLNLPIVDLQGLATEEQSAEVQRLAILEATKPFDLSNSPLVRVTLLRLKPQVHVFLLNIHHIVSDAWSIGIFIQELSALYVAFSAGKNSPLPELSIQYADFATWQRQWLSGEVYQAKLNYWKQQLADAPPLLELPTDRSRPAIQTFKGSSLCYALAPNLTEKLKLLSQKSGVTLFMTLHAAFALLIHRYSGQNDICIGTPIANRNRKEIEPLIGFFVNTLVLRSRLEGNPSFAQLLKQVQQVTLEAYEHQDVPFDRVVEALQKQRNLSHTPLFQVMFALQNAPMVRLELPGVAIAPLEIETVTSKFDLTLSMEETPQGLIGTWEYSTDLFNPDTITRMAGHLQNLLEAIVTFPEATVYSLSFLSEKEKHQLLREWNATHLEYPLSCIHQLFEKQVQKTPDAVAVVYEERHLTYFELNTRANQVSHYLRSLGVVAEMPVGICLDRSLEMVVGLLGILKAGGAYVPLDPAYPSDRLSYMLSDSQAVLLLTNQKLRDLFPEHQAKIVYLDRDWEVMTAFSSENAVSNTSASNLAYVIYTSGSTGTPKGVAIEHRSAANFIHWAQEVFSPKQLAGVLASTSVCFDLSIFELFVPLCSGGKVILAENALHLPTLSAAKDVTLINTVPSAIAELLRSNAIPQGVGTVNLAGEALPDRLVQQLYQQQTIEKVFNLYGPSETTTYSTYTLCVPNESLSEQANSSPSIGRPLANTQIYILDAYLQPVPIGVVGELYIGGAGLARCYLNRPELTQEKFIPNPFSNLGLGDGNENKDVTAERQDEKSNNPKSCLGKVGIVTETAKTPTFRKIQNPKSNRLYKTGDLARYLPDGNIQFLGRIDNQVKIRGFRIELGEIEAIAIAHPQVQQAAVIVREDQPGRQQLVAYIVPKEPLIASEMRSFLKQKLPDYMVPNVFVFLEALPLTSSGKIDRRSLPAPEWEWEGVENFIFPQTPTQQAIANTIAEVLGIEQVGIHDNFFEIGGHSLLATQVISRLQQIFQVELPVRCLFESPTVAELDISISTRRCTNAQFSKNAIAPIPRNNLEMPLSGAQARLWFLEQLEGQTGNYNLPATVQIKGNLNVEALQQTLVEIVRRHEVLHTSFKLVNDTPVQVLDRTASISLPVVNLQGLPEEEQWNEVQQRATEAAKLPFDLQQAPLVRSQLLKLSEDSHVLLLNLHHIVSDGWSLGILIQELSVLYPAFSAGQPSPLAPLPIQYADFAHWQRQWLNGEAYLAQLSYWQQQLADAPPLLELPSDRVRPPVQTFQGKHFYKSLNLELTQKLKALSQKSGVTLFMTLLAAFVTLLYRYSSQDDVSIGTPIANRNRKEIEPLIGFFVNTLVLRTRLEGNPSFAQLLKQVQQVALDAYDHQDVPFEQVVEALQPQRNLSHSPLFQVMFALQNAPMGALELSGLTLTPLEIETGIAKFDLTLSMEETPQGLMGVWEYNSDLFERETIARMAVHFQTLLEAVVANPQQQIASLPILTDKERHQLLIEWNDTASNYPATQCIHQLFEEQVQRTPDELAIVYETESLTYAELNARANQLARYLRSLGVGPEVLVGLCVERSLEMIVGLLGVLKAGGAYVPLDPSYPSDRLIYMLSDARVPVLLTQQSLVDLLPEYETKLVCLDADWDVIKTNGDENFASATVPSNLAYAIYTSGSTGKPKGVLVCHQGLCNLALAQIQLFGVSVGSRVLQFASLSFDASVSEIFMALCAGATLVLSSSESMLPGPDLTQLLHEQAITHVTLPPSALFGLTERQLPALQSLILAGEAGAIQALGQWSSHRRCFNAYGPTEATVCATVFEIGDTSHKPPIGRAIANTQIYILDRYLQPVPIGVWGELHISGVGLARGYLNRPDLTEAKFIPNPFGDSKLYKTGDLARYLPDGNIEFGGRIDNQVKIRGFRIELEEIEALLTAHPKVQQAVVSVREETVGDKRLVAYIVPKELPTKTELHAFLKQKLPDYMMPYAFVMMESLPLTPNGKVDRRLLPSPEIGQLESNNFVAPRTPLERVLAKMWSQILVIEKIGIHDNFFYLGGHSLLATQIVSRIKQTFDIELPVRYLFQNPTVAELASAIAGVAGNREVIEEMASIFEEIAELSPEQVQSMLIQEKENC